MKEIFNHALLPIGIILLAINAVLLNENHHCSDNETMIYTSSQIKTGLIVCKGDTIIGGKSGKIITNMNDGTCRHLNNESGNYRCRLIWITKNCKDNFEEINRSGWSYNYDYIYCGIHAFNEESYVMYYYLEVDTIKN